MYSVRVQAKASRQLRKLAKKYRRDYQALEDAISTLANWPEVTGVKALTRHTYGYRLRVGRFRVFFDVGKDVKVIFIGEVERRDDHTY